MASDHGFLVQGLREFLQAGNNLRRFRQDGGRQFLRIIRTALRHLRKRHHDRERIIYGMLDLAEFRLQLDQLFVRNIAGGSLMMTGFHWRKSRR